MASLSLQCQTGLRALQQIQNRYDRAYNDGVQVTRMFLMSNNINFVGPVGFEPTLPGT